MKLWYIMIGQIEVDSIKAKDKETAEQRAKESGYRDVTVKAAA